MILSDLVRHPMPKSVRGALLRTVPPLSTQPIRTVWVPASSANPDPVSPGAVLLSWDRRSNGRTDVTALLGLAKAEVLLATWPGLRGNWIPVVHPTLFEVTNLHAALTVATDALLLANHLAAG